MYGKRIEWHRTRREIDRNLAYARADGDLTYQGSECAYNQGHGRERYVYFSTCVKCVAEGFRGSARRGITKTEAWYAKTTKQKFRAAKQGGYKLDRYLFPVDVDPLDDIIGITPKKRAEVQDEPPALTPKRTVKKKQDGTLTKRQLSIIRKQNVIERATKKGGR